MRAARSLLDSSRVVCGHVVACLLALAVGAAASGQTTWFVSNDPAENPDFPGLYEALQSPLVVDGDTIEVSEGLDTYYPPMGEYYEVIDRALTIRAQPDERPVLAIYVDLTFPFTTFVIGGTPSTVLEGFEIRSGGQYAMTAGGSSIVRDCLFKSGARQSVLLAGGGTRFESCEFRALSGLFGPYIEASGGVTFDACLFTQNIAGVGAIEVSGNAVFRQCDFIANRVPGIGAEIDGAPSSNILIDSCRFLQTSVGTSTSGRPVVLTHGTLAIVNSVFHESGGPTVPLVRVDTTAPMFALVVNSTFNANAVRCITESVGLGAIAVRNSIVWNNTLSQPAFVGAAAVQYSNIQGGWAGTGNISTNPAFKAAGQADFRLNPGSPCIDRGDNNAVPAGITLDLAGRPRFFDDPDTPNNNGSGTPPIVDMGAYEYQGPFVCVPDLTTTANPFAPGFGEPDGVLNNEDFFYYLLLFANANPEADLTTTAIPGTTGYGTPNGVINNDDFFYYLGIFAAGCEF